MPDPGEPDSGSAGRYLWWLLRRQKMGIAVAGICASVWMGSIGALPGVIGFAIDDGLVASDHTALLLWSGTIIALAMAMAAMGTVRHRLAVHNFLTGAYRTVQLTTRQATRVGAVLPRRIATGEIVAVGGNDPIAIGSALDVLGRTVGSLVTFTAVAVVLLNISPLLGVVILIGLPLQALLIGPLLRPLQRREHDYRHEQGKLTSRANDIVAGLRVLRGVGGEDLFHDRYTDQSQHVRRFGLRVAMASAVMKGLQILLPGLLLAAVTWLGARLTVSGDISSGQLISVFGYTAFLLIPMNVFLETARKYTTAHAAASRVVTVLNIDPGVDDPGPAGTAVDRIGSLDDPDSGLHVPADSFTAVACTSPADAAAICERLARYEDSDVAADGVALRDMPLSLLRSKVLLTDNAAHFFAGSLREALDVHGEWDDAAIMEAVRVCVAGDAVDSLGGLDGELDAEARNVSGGQRQRLRLVRALLADPEVSILVDPTSAVDAHTESLIAEQTAKARRGRTTVVTTTSPLVLEHADHIAFVDEGKVRAVGTHKRLWESERHYRALVSRQTGDHDAMPEES